MESQNSVMEYQKFEDLPVVDKDVIKGIPWAENMLVFLLNGLNRSFLYWCAIVLKMGENDDVVKKWVDVFKKNYEETCCMMVTDMESVHSRVLLKIEALLKECQQLCNTLQIKLPQFGDVTAKRGLHQEQQELRARIDEYKKLVEKRRAELNDLRAKELDLCNSLGQEPMIMQEDPLPSPEQLEKFQKHIEELEAEKFSRLETFISVKEELLPIAEELHFKPSSKFERDFFSLDDSTFLVTDYNMKQLEQLRKDLIKQETDVKKEIFILRNKIDEYWNVLDVDLKEREDFRQQYAGNSLDILQALRTEIKRCEALKKANIKVFIDKLRDELKQLWDKCHCSEESKAQFKFFDTDCYSEDLLGLHEVEIEKWRKYYDENKELLILLEKHRYVWNKMIELEENAAGPNRYKNRGGQLLKEEKERNRLHKQLPQIEERLYDLSECYQQKYDCYFTTYGTTVEQYLSNLRGERENEKKQKLSARKLQREQALTPGKSALNLFPHSQILRSATPLSTTKRKLAIPAADLIKRPKVASEKKNTKTNKTAAPTLKVISASNRSKRLSVERKKRIDKIRRLSSNKAKSQMLNTDDTLSSEYDRFQSELSTKDNCRSTIIPNEEAPVSTPLAGRKIPTFTLTAATPRTPMGRTPPNLRLRARAPNTNTKKLSAAKPNVRLQF